MMIQCSIINEYVALNPDDPIITDCVDDDIRLIGGSTSLEGTVEICRNKVWGGVCGNSWNVRDANVVCSQLGYQTSGITYFTFVNFFADFSLAVLIYFVFAGSMAVYNSFYGKSSGLIYIDYAHCTGTETKLKDCHYSPSIVSLSCGDIQHAGVKCIGRIFRCNLKKCNDRYLSIHLCLE